MARRAAWSTPRRCSRLQGVNTWEGSSSAGCHDLSLYTLAARTGTSTAYRPAAHAAATTKRRPRSDLHAKAAPAPAARPTAAAAGSTRCAACDPIAAAPTVEQTGYQRVRPASRAPLRAFPPPAPSPSPSTRTGPGSAQGFLARTTGQSAARHAQELARLTPMAAQAHRSGDHACGSTLRVFHTSLARSQSNVVSIAADGQGLCTRCHQCAAVSFTLVQSRSGRSGRVRTRRKRGSSMAQGPAKACGTRVSAACARAGEALGASRPFPLQWA